MNKLNKKLVSFVLETGEITNEKREKEIYQTFSQGLMYTYILTIISMIVSIANDYIYYKHSLSTTLLVFLFLFISGFISNKLHHFSLTNTNVYTEQEYLDKISKLKTISLFNGLYFGIGMFLSMEIIYKYYNQDIPTNLIFPKLILYIIMGFPFGIIIYYIRRAKLNKEY
ncbi:hypothetical protein [Mammaliicoccus lentus]|uniref:hypothetical protein n=1 Tax=Mammaliicoccus lentus TaxID=42858 RepID=UPI00374F4D7E